MGLHHCWSKTVCALDLELLRLLAPPRHASGLRLHLKVNKVSEIGLENSPEAVLTNSPEAVKRFDCTLGYLDRMPFAKILQFDLQFDGTFRVESKSASPSSIFPSFR